MKKRYLGFFVITLFIGIMVGAIMNFDFSHLKSREVFGNEKNKPINLETDPDVQMLQKFSNGFVKISNSVRPSVVTIISEKTIKVAQNPFFNPFFDDFFGFPFGNSMPKRDLKQKGLGSGVIISEDGYILTNNHVVSGADELTIKLHDNKEYKGKIIGTDEKTDLALIKIDAENLKKIKIGDSDKLQVGEWVVAVGSPFELEQTVTTGIVSALGRTNLGITDYEDFIQTDAAINPGNSGGALVNLKGELVGINTAIASRSGGYQGIGFAIPVNSAMRIVEELKVNKKVTRGWLGVVIGDITDENAEAFGLKEPKGVVVNQVMKDSPAEKAGIKEGDIILEIDNKEVKNVADLRSKIAFKKPGTEVKVKLSRKSKILDKTVIIGDQDTGNMTSTGTYSDKLLGIEVHTIDTEMLQKYRLRNDVDGVVIVSINEDSPLSGQIVKVGDIISEIRFKGDIYETKNLQEYKNAVSNLKKGDKFVMKIQRGESSFFVTVRIPNNTK